MGFLLNQSERAPFHWLSGDGRPVASVRYTPEELSQRNGILFARGSDDLDGLSFAAYSPVDRFIPAWSEIPALMVLIRYDNDPDPGTTVYADANLDVAQAQQTVHTLLGLTHNDFTWLAEHTEAHAGAYVTEHVGNRAALDQDIEIPLREQEVITSKQAVVTGSVGGFITETQRAGDTVRREEVHVEGMSKPRIHTDGFSTQQQMWHNAMGEVDRARYERFTERERAQYDAMTADQRRTWAAEYDRRNPGSGVFNAFRDRDHTRR